MWASPHHGAAGVALAEMWPGGPDGAAMDYVSPVAGTPLAGTPMSGMLSPFASSSPFADIAAHACHQAPALEAQVQTISSRVQKLERSRGQISKDLADMLSETRDLRKKVSLSDARKQDATDGPPGLGSARRTSRVKTAPPSLPRVPEEQPLSGSKPAPALAPQPQPAGERISPPPGLSLPPPPPVPAQAEAPARMQEALTVQPKEASGFAAARVEWRIDGAKAKFKDCVGRPLVSPQFEAAGLPELRLMVFPNLGLDTSGLTMREQKCKYEARITEGPLSGALKFKVVTNFSDNLVVNFNLFVGDVVQGPIEHNFADHIIYGVNFESNWLDQMKNGSLTVGVELIAVQGQPVRAGGGVVSVNEEVADRKSVV